MNILDIIKTRKSVRTFDGNKISDEDKNKLLSYAQTIENPYDIPVNFVFLDSEKFNLNVQLLKVRLLYCCKST